MSDLASLVPSPPGRRLVERSKCGPDRANWAGNEKTEARRIQMTIGADNLSNGPTTQDRFSGGVSAYRQTRREAALAAEHGDGELVDRHDTPLPTRSPGMSGSMSPGSM